MITPLSYFDYCNIILVCTATCFFIIIAASRASAISGWSGKLIFFLMRVPASAFQNPSVSPYPKNSNIAHHQ